MNIDEIRNLQIVKYHAKTPKLLNYTNRDIYLVTNKNVLYFPKENKIEFQNIKSKKIEKFYSSDDEFSIEVIEKECRLNYFNRDDNSLWDYYILENREQANIVKRELDLSCYYIGDTIEVDGKLYVLNLCVV